MAHSDDEIITEIQRVAQAADTDGPPSLRTFKQHGTIGFSAVDDQFGSWNAAVEAAGFEPNTATEKISRDALIDELQRLRAELGEIPTADQMDDTGAYAYITYYERFGSWADALEMVFGEVPDRTWEHVSDAELLADLQRLAGDDGACPTVDDVEERGSHAVQTYRDRFGSWQDAVEKAGFDQPTSQGVTTAELLADLRRLRDEFGTKPTTRMVTEHGHHSIRTYYSRFDSWDTILNKAFDDTESASANDS